MLSDSERREDDLETQVDKFVFRVRRGYLYTADDMWLRPEEDGVRVGLTDFLQRRSGDVAFVKPVKAGAQVSAGGRLAEIETIKTTLTLPAPVDGRVTAVNEDLTDRPELINEDPYGEGWLAVIALPEGRLPAGLLEAGEYFALMKDKLAEEVRRRD